MPAPRRHAPRRRLPTTAALATLGLAGTALAQVPQQTAVEVTAVATLQPPALQFTWPADPTANGFTVARRPAGTEVYGPTTTIPGGGAATSWTDTGVDVGVRYEYLFQKTGSPNGKGLLTAGIAAAPLEDRGAVVLLVDATHVPVLAPRLDRLVLDLVGDGWTVLRHDVLPTAPVTAVKALIVADVAARPDQVRAVFLFGHVPVPYSGWIAPDGHPDHAGAWPADVFYGELDGPWTDVSVNAATATRPQNRNVPADGKYDQSTLPSDVDLQVGRVDLADMPSFALGETALLAQYLDKDHDWRHGLLTATPRAVIDDNFGFFYGEAFAASGYRNFAALLGPQNVVVADYFTTLNTPTGPGWLWSYGCGGGWYQGAGGVGNTPQFAASSNRNVFTMLFGSYFGDWDSTDNFLRAPLCSGWTLTNAWAGRPHWSFHPLTLGETFGYCARLSQNDTTVGGYGARTIHIALMGDPTLREHVVAPPGAVAVGDFWPQANVTWVPSPDAVAGYHVYRAPSPFGPFKRLTAAPVVGTTFADPAARAGDATYLVRALRLETTPGGSYWNLSQGTAATVHLPQAAARHTALGDGCYRVSNSFHQTFATAAAARAALQGRALTLLPVQGGYDVAWGGAAFVPPSGAARRLQLADDAETAVPTAQPVAFPGASTRLLWVHSNGIVGAGPLGLAAPASASPAPAVLLGAAAAAHWCWHDFDPTEPGSGPILVEEDAQRLCVTWLGVESHPAGPNPSTLQFQYDFATGAVHWVFAAITGLGTGRSTAPSEPFLLGWSPAGPSTDGGAVDLVSALPFHVGAVDQAPLQLTATPTPLVTPTQGCQLLYRVDAVPAAAPGTHVACLLLGFAADPLGPSLQSLGMPDCRRYLATIDASLLAVTGAPQATFALMLPAGTPPGTVLHAQALALFPPNSLPNGQNALGAVTSNGLATFVNDH